MSETERDCDGDSVTGMISGERLQALQLLLPLLMMQLDAAAKQSCYTYLIGEKEEVMMKVETIIVSKTQEDQLKQLFGKVSVWR